MVALIGLSCRAGQSIHQQRETMSHDSAGNDTLILLLIITHFADVDYSLCFIIHFRVFFIVSFSFYLYSEALCTALFCFVY